MSEQPTIQELPEEAIVGLQSFMQRIMEDMDDQDGFQPNDLVLLDLGGATRTEAIVVEVAENSVKCQLNNGTSHWYNPEVIVDELGTASREKLLLHKFEVPPEPPTPQYTTGTYVLLADDGPILVEVDRVEDEYFIHATGDSNAAPLTPEIWERLQTFSDPDEPGEYILEPGVYLASEVGRVIEVIPHGGRSFYRFIDEAWLQPLTAGQQVECKRIESDTLEVNAAIVIDTSAPAEPECDGSGQCEKETCGT